MLAHKCGGVVDGLLLARSRGFIRGACLLSAQLAVGAVLVCIWVAVGIPAALIHCALNLKPEFK